MSIEDEKIFFPFCETMRLIHPKFYIIFYLKINKQMKNFRFQMKRVAVIVACFAVKKQRKIVFREFGKEDKKHCLQQLSFRCVRST